MSTLTPQRARALLGLPLSGPLSQEEIVSAWRKAVRANHSDRSGDDTLATDTLLSKKILLQEMEFPDLSWKTGKGGRPPLISDLQPDSIYSGSDVEDFLDLLSRPSRRGPRGSSYASDFESCPRPSYKCSKASVYTRGPTSDRRRVFRER
jgi:hypothetical protein